MKLEAKDLRIGNYVQLRYNYDYTIDWGDGTVEEITIEEIDIYLLKALIDGDDFKPIPLTVEWLEKLGFKSDKYHTGETFYLNISTEERFDYKTTIEVIDYGDCMLVSIRDLELNESGNNNSITIKKFKHVHQIQNLYHALTGEELTIKK